MSDVGVGEHGEETLVFIFYAVVTDNLMQLREVANRWY